LKIKLVVVNLRQDLSVTHHDTSVSLATREDEIEVVVAHVNLLLVETVGVLLSVDLDLGGLSHTEPVVAEEHVSRVVVQGDRGRGDLISVSKS